MHKLSIGIRTPLARRALRLGVGPATEHLPLLRRLPLNTIIDVGANTGQFALAARLAGFSGDIYSFEPLPEAARTFRAVFADDQRAHITERALSDVIGTALLHVSNQLDSSSLLNIGAKQVEFFPGTDEKAVREVTLSLLDEELRDTPLIGPSLLKIDVQGHELGVLRGATSSLDRIDHIYVELSFDRLYDDQPLAGEVVRYLSDKGYHLAEIGHATFVGGRSIQADLLFSRKDSSRDDGVDR